MLEYTAPTLGQLDALSKRYGDFLLFFEPPCIDARITNQFALFSVMPGARASVPSWMAAHPNAWRAVDIPAKVKWEIRDRLDGMNVTERVLFPGLDGLATWLRRHYGPGP